eukprot:gene11124-50856_t
MSAQRPMPRRVPPWRVGRDPHAGARAAGRSGCFLD